MKKVKVEINPKKLEFEQAIKLFAKNKPLKNLSIWGFKRWRERNKVSVSFESAVQFFAKN